MTKDLKPRLEKLHRKYNKRRYVHPDPLEFLYNYKDIRDREIVGLIASSLAYGRVTQILKSVSSVLAILGESPYLFIHDSTPKNLCKIFKNFKHRFANGKHLASLFCGIKRVTDSFGSLNECFIAGISSNDETIIPAMTFLVNQLTSNTYNPGHLVALPEKGSACKRMNLFLRWMVRKDKVDPGGWKDIPASRLIIPLDTHMHRIGLMLGLTSRKQANMRTALEITDSLKKIVPDDPIKYDFSLTRFGIRDDMNMDDFVGQVMNNTRILH